MKQISKTLGFALGILAVAVLPAWADSPAAAPAFPTKGGPVTGGPKIQFDSDSYDFGKVPAGQHIKHSFIFTNIGDATLEVTRVNPTCGCTVAGDWTKKVEPGQTGVVPLDVNVAAGWNGPMQKTVTVDCNDKTRGGGPVPLHMNFVVWRPIDVSQSYVILNIPAGTTTEVSAKVLVNNNMDEPLSLFEATSENPAFKVEIKTNEFGKHYELEVSALPPYIPGKSTSGQIKVKTSATNMTSLSLTAAANIQQVFQVMPNQVVVEAPPLANPVQKSVTIQYQGSGLAQLTEPTFSEKGVDVQITESQPGKLFMVTLSFPAGFEVSGKPMELSLKSSSSLMPVLKIPVHQMPKVSHQVVPIKPAPATVSAPVGKPQAAVAH